MIIKLIWIIFAHYVLDYLLQGEFLASTKGEYWYSLFAHSTIYALGMSLVLNYLGCFSIEKLTVILCFHYIIDGIKSTLKDRKIYLYIDQGLHILIDILMLIV